MTDHALEQEMEIEALEAILMDDFKEIDPSESGVSTTNRCFQITLSPQEDDLDASNYTPVQLALIFSHTEKYPDEPPLLNVKSIRGIKTDDLNMLQEKLGREAHESLGMAMIYTLATSAKDWLHEKYGQNVLDEVAEEPASTKDDIIIPHGEPVTTETFIAWRERFEAELALERAKLMSESALSAPKDKRLTGRQWFESGRAAAVIFCFVPREIVINFCFCSLLLYLFSHSISDYFYWFHFFIFHVLASHFWTFCLLYRKAQLQFPRILRKRKKLTLMMTLKTMMMKCLSIIWHKNLRNQLRDPKTEIKTEAFHLLGLRLLFLWVVGAAQVLVFFSFAFNHPFYIGCVCAENLKSVEWMGSILFRSVLRMMSPKKYSIKHCLLALLFGYIVEDEKNRESEQYIILFPFGSSNAVHPMFFLITLISVCVNQQFVYTLQKCLFFVVPLSPQNIEQLGACMVNGTLRISFYFWFLFYFFIF